MSVPIAAKTDLRHLAPERGFLHRLFELSLILKGLFAAVESLAGLALFYTANTTIQNAVTWLLHRELIEDPTDPGARWIQELAARFNADSQHFYAVYLLGHGLVKLVVILALARRITAAYPLAIAVFTGFIVYQLHRWTLTHSPAMLALSVFDLLVIWLTWREWRHGLPPRYSV